MLWLTHCMACRDVLVASCIAEAATALQQRVAAIIGQACAHTPQWHPAGGASCCYCGQPPEKAVTLHACGCKTCAECIQPMLKAAAELDTSFPIQCICGTPICWPDMLSLSQAQPEILETLKLKAYNQYMHKNQAAIFGCKGVDCPQFGRRGDGSDPCDWYCDMCQARYCVTCQDALGAIAPRHPGMTCAEYQGARTSADFQLDSMKEFSKCPGCHIPVEKENCTCLHMRCTYCDMHFCHGCNKGFGQGLAGGHSTYGHIPQCDGPRAHAP